MITLNKQHRRYEKYQAAGVQWLDTIPQQWKMLRNQSQFNVARDIVNEHSNDFVLLSLTLKGIIPRDVESGKGKFPESFDSYQKVQKRDLVFCLFDIDETPRTVGLSSLEGMVTGAYTVVRCHKDACAKYIYYYYLSLDFEKRLRPLYTGLRKVIRPNAFLHAKMPVPSVVEQASIASYLDEKCKLIDEIITKKQKQIELLQEQRAAIINRAVTKGLDEGVEMKESGVEWVGKIPKNWEVMNMKYLALFQNGYAFSSDTYADEGLPIVRIGDIGEPHIDQNELRRVPSETRSAIQNFRIKRGDILLALTGATIGKSTLCETDEEMYLNQRVAILRPSKRISNGFLDLIIRSDYFQEKIRVICFGGAQDNIGKPDIGRIPVFIPSVDQQNLIVTEAERLLGSQGKMLIKIENSISLLNEYKTSLISHVVTGKVKVSDESQ